MPLLLPEHFAPVAAFGAPTGYHPLRASWRIGMALAALLLLAGSGLLAAFGIYEAAVQAGMFGPAALERAAGQYGPLALGLFALGGGFGLSALALWNKGVAVFEAGLAYHNGWRLECVSWEACAGFYMDVTRFSALFLPGGEAHRYRICTRDGRSLHFDDRFERAGKLGERIRRAVGPRQYQEARERLDNDGQVSFGPLTLARDALVAQGTPHKWKTVREIELRQGRLRIRFKDGDEEKSIPAAHIPNLDAFLALAAQAARVRAG
jgi:hypothetical protein